MRKTVQRLLAAVMILVMVVTLLPSYGFAAHSHTHEEAAKSETRSITAGKYVIAANVGGTYYAIPSNFDMDSYKIIGVQIPVTNGAITEADAANYTVTIAASGSNITISNGTKYLKYTSGTNLSTSTTAYEWSVSAGTNGTYRIVSAATTTRGLIFRAGSYNRFGAYATSNATATSTEYYDVELLPVGSGDSGGTTEGAVSSVSLNGEYVIAANVGGTYYAMSNTFASKINGTAITVTNGKVSAADAAPYKVTIKPSGKYHTISSGSNYLSYSSSTDLGSSTTAFDWAITSGINGSYRAVATTDNSRVLAFQSSSTEKRFGGYSTSNVTAGSTTYYDIEILPIAAESTDTGTTTVTIEDGNYVIAAFVNGTYYAMTNYFSEKIDGVGITVENGCVSTEAAEGYVVTITANGDYYTIKNETGYLRYTTGTNLGYSASTAYDWSITQGSNGTYRVSAAATLGNTTVRSLSYRTDDYNTFGAYATNNIINQTDSYYDIELLPVGDPADYTKTIFTLVNSADALTAGDYLIVSQAINSNNRYYALMTEQESGSYQMTSKLLADTTLPEKITINEKDFASLVWTMTGTRTSFTLMNSAGAYLANSSSEARLNLSSTATTWAGSVFSTTKNGFHISAKNYYISLRDDSATLGSNGNPLFGSVAVTTSPEGHIYMNLYRACAHESVKETTIPATCIESGTSSTTCEICGEVIAWTSYPATGHTIVYTPNEDATHNIYCETCGYEEGVGDCVYSNLSCYLCGNPEPENDFSGRYYFATIRSSANSTYHYMTFDLVGTSTRRYASEDSGLTTLPSVITAPVSNKVYVIEKNDAGTYRIFAEGLAGDNCLAWEVDANASENSGAFADTFNAYELTIGLSGGDTDGNKIVNIYFVENNLPRYLSLNNTTGNNYFAWYTNASSQRKDIVLLPVEGEATCLHTNRTTVVTDPTCTSNGVETIYCADCGVIVGENELLALGHSMEYQWVEDGWHYAACANCEYALTEECTIVGQACIYCSGGDLECFQLVTSAADLTTDRYIIIAKATQGAYVGDYSYYGLGLQQDSNHNAMGGFGMNFNELPTEIYLEGSDTANLVWNLTGTKDGFTLTTDAGNSLYHNTGNDLFCGNYSATTWTGDFSTTEGHFAVKHNNSYYLSLRTDWDTLNDSDNYAPLINCVNNTDTGNYKFFFFKKYDGCLHENTNTTIVEPTCTTSGYEKVVCLDCNQVLTSNVLDAYGHDPFAYEANDPTCTLSGNTAYWYCADCDSYFADELCTKATTQEAIAIPALGHSWDDGQITTTPTCTTTGVMTYICYVCTTTKTETIPASGHFYTRVVTAPTCTAQGYTTFTCSGCGDSYKANYTDPFGHKYTYTNNNDGTHMATCTNGCGTSVKESCTYTNGICVCGAVQNTQCAHTNTKTTTVNATCTAAGSITVVCTDCGVTVSYTEIAATGHSYKSVVTAPTCTAQGYTTYTCSTCSNSYKSNYTNPIGHSYTYTNQGNGQHTIGCANGCGYSASANCSYTDGKCVCGATICTHSNTTTTTTNATCTTAGSTVVTCKDCGVTISTTTIPATGHKLSEVAAKAATCTESGCNKHWRCQSCNGYFADSTGSYSLPESFVVIAATGHSYVYTNNGTTHTITCTNGCGYSVTQDHTYVDSTCVCGAVEVEALPDYSGRYYIAGKRVADTTYQYLLGAMDGTRYDIVDSGLDTLPTSITAPESDKVFVIEKNADGTYRISVEGISGDAKYLGWTSGNTGSFVTAENALSLTIDQLSTGYFNIHFTSGTDQRFLSINSSTNNSYAAWYRTGQIKALALIPVAKPTEVFDKDLTFSMNISAGADMKVVYTIYQKNVTAFTDFYLVVNKAVADGETITTTYGFEEGMESFTTTIIPTTGAAYMHRATFAGIYAREMGDVFEATLYAVAADGTIHYSSTNTSSMKTYLTDKINDATSITELKTMSVDMLNYGAAAQLHFGYDTDNLANADLTEAQLAYATKELPQAQNLSTSVGTGATLRGNVSLKAKVILTLTCIYTPTNASDLKYVICDAEDGTQLAVLPATVTNNVLCKATYEDVGAKQMRRLIKATLYEGDKAVSTTLSWSVESYVAATRVSTSATATQINMVNAMLTYGDSVAAYLTASGQ